MKIKYLAFLLGLTPALFLTGCATEQPPKMDYSPKNFIPANIVANANPASKIVVPTDKAGLDSVLTSASFTNSPQLVNAYNHYLKTGNAEAVKGTGFITLPYSPYSKPIIQCAPLQTCQIVLEKNEVVNGVSLGDTKRWIQDKMYEGTPGNGSWIILLKPKALNIATSLSIATNKRIYNFRVMSKEGQSPTVNFWYPHDMVQDRATQAELKREQVTKTSNATVSSSPSGATFMNVNNLNFNYSLMGDTPAWTPSKVFDDGDKTFIRMPAITDRTSLPVLYVYDHGKQAMVNYRYKRPYIIVDGLFWKAALVSGKGDDKSEVDIKNNNFKG